MLDKIVVLICLISGAFAISTNVTVGGLGNVIGLQETTAWTNRTMYSFRGIPYAEPPIGDLRFRPPVKITTWNGTLYATEYGSVCPQNESPFTKETGDNEDCLTLNVFVPQVVRENATLPVMIWIHGGSFTYGHASRYKPHYFLEEDVILVVPQFRLGPFGLLCLQTDEVPGNVQFLDQIMAMQWVQDNIGYFGGNPKEVTLFGQSSGAASVNLHQFSPLSRGLFHRVIIQSGSAFGPFVMDYNPLDTAAKLGALVGCTQTNVTELTACFKGLDVQSLLDGFDDYLALYSMDGLQRIGGHRAVVQIAGAQRFLEKSPSALLAKSEYTQVPMIGGATKHDGVLPFLVYYWSYFLPRGLVNDTDFLTYNLTSYLVSQFGITDESGGVSQTLTSVHFEDGQIGDFSKMTPGIIDIASVLLFKAPVLKMLQENSRVSTSYAYRFGYFGTIRALESGSQMPFETGVGHSDDLYYLFPLTNLSGHDLTVAKRIISLWTSFAITGEPTADNETWQPMNTFGPYLIIDEALSHGSNYLSEYTITSKEGLTAVHRSSGTRIAPECALAVASMLLFIRRS